MAVAAAHWLARPIPLRYVLTVWLLPVVFALPGFLTDRTILPVDHAMFSPPWRSPGAVAPHNSNLNDVVTQIAPFARAVRMAWKEGSLPLRQRWNGCGTPLAANAQSSAFSPLTLLMFALPLARAFTLAAAVKLFLALLGTWLWLSELGVSRIAALFGAVSFGFSCAMTPWILFPLTAVICLWPWALFAIELLGDEAVGHRAFWILTGVFLCWAVGGHPESAALGGLFAGLWLLARLLLRDLPRPGLVLARVALAAATSLGLSAFLLVPQALAIRDSNRVPFMEEFVRRLPFRLAPHGPLWANGLVTAVFPRSLGDDVASPMVGARAGSFPEMAQGYFGIVGWAAALAVLRPGSRRKRSEIALLVPLLLGLAVAIGQWPVFELALLAPVLRLMLSLRYFTWVALAGSAIAAFEIDRLRGDLFDRRRGTSAIVALPIGLAVYAVVEFHRLRPLHEASGGLPSQEKALAVVLICLGLAAVLFLVPFWNRRPAVVAVCFFCLSAGTAAELLYQGMRLYRFGSPAGLYPDTPMIAFLRSRPGPFRVVGEGAVLFPNSNIFAGVEDVRTHDPIERRDYVAYLDSCCGYKPDDYFKNIRDFNADALDRLNVKYFVSVPGRAPPGPKWTSVYSGDDGTVFENRAVLPRVFAPGGPGLVSISDYREKTNSISFRANVFGQDGTLVVASLVQDGGWSARDEQKPLRIERAEGLLTGIRLGPGEHRVTLRYRPPGFAAGSAVTLVIVVVLLSRAIFRSSSSKAAPAL